MKHVLEAVMHLLITRRQRRDNSRHMGDRGNYLDWNPFSGTQFSAETCFSIYPFLWSCWYVTHNCHVPHILIISVSGASIDKVQNCPFWKTCNEPTAHCPAVLLQLWTMLMSMCKEIFCRSQDDLDGINQMDTTGARWRNTHELRLHMGG